MKPIWFSLFDFYAAAEGWVGKRRRGGRAAARTTTGGRRRTGSPRSGRKRRYTRCNTATTPGVVDNVYHNIAPKTPARDGISIILSKPTTTTK